MDRRTALSLIASVGATALAGCTGSGADDGTDGDETDGSTGDDGTDGSTGDDGTDGPDDSTTEPPADDGSSPSITDRSFSRLGDAAEPGESASVAFDGDRVRCAGVIQGRNGCMEAELDSATYDADGDELRVRVTTVREGGDYCTQQIVDREYEAVVTFAGGLPGAVVVEHESMGEVRTATDVTR
ncbi:hypothetical protein Hbl1158_04945 [Halobaculum sp. CBA1158]|uniref:hypothetical protein n=1 Tax=Halobaculum sp. CBA1158 TaxID=2904243 RepID=UPI001F45ACD5|nr:hypothetical protein [Halobaculum sp. CBA1158]UIP00707.1 hypothetical protein Hbl1158_04945 [Halobaculum sp. CBA1158]